MVLSASLINCTFQNLQFNPRHIHSQPLHLHSTNLVSLHVLDHTSVNLGIGLLKHVLKTSSYTTQFERQLF